MFSEDIERGPGTWTSLLEASRSFLQNAASGVCSDYKDRNRWSDPVALVIPGTRGRTSLLLLPD